MMRRVLALAICLCLARPAAPALAAVTGDPIGVDGGQVSGVWRENAAVRAYLGVPFAAPPLGDLRWKPPHPPRAWTGVKAAVAAGPQCVQRPTPPASLGYEVYGSPPQSEDCLTINVWAPPAKPGARAPVIVWIYGGSFDHGSAGYPVYDGARLARRGVVVVSFNYRVGVLGFMAHPELTAEGGGASGNYGFLDQVAALAWVKRNAAAFGGDPANVTIFGQSAGAGSVYALMASPLARGLFQRAIAESLGLFELGSLAQGEANGRKIAATLGAASLAELRTLPADSFLAPELAAPPIVDGRFLSETLSATFARGGEARVPLLTGWNSDEGTKYPVFPTRAAFRNVLQAVFGANAERAGAFFATPTDADAVEQSLELTRDVGFAARIYRGARLHARSGQPVYLYHFERRSPFRPGQHFSEIEPASRFGAYHAAELPYVFATLDTIDRDFEPADRALSGLLQTYWVNFATRGNPNGPRAAAGRGPLPRWPRYGGGAAGVLHIGDSVHVGPVPNLERLRFIDGVAVRMPGGG
ncbi:carboxylesterase/lipase family protein [Phenylobacterium sp.]|uniref:carboxylesterase/lipase family protein n=1 Tax=Phenylobacterium sp. TaxID=1871053 RepID=UPI003569B7DB